MFNKCEYLFFITVSPQGLLLSFALMTVSFLQVQVGVKELETGKIPSGLAGRLPNLLPHQLPCPTGPAPSPGRPARCRATTARPRTRIGWAAWLPAGPTAPGSCSRPSVSRRVAAVVSERPTWAVRPQGWEPFPAELSAARRHRRKSAGGTASWG